MNTPPISIEALMVLDAIEDRGSYAAAAEQLNKVPSALSYVVQKLEEQLQVTLFIRQGRRAILTPAGKHLLTEGRKLLQAVNSLSEQTQTIANGWEPKIRIACDAIVDLSAVYKKLSRFLAEHQSIEIDVQEEVMNGTWEALIEDRVDLVIGAPAPIPSQKGIRAVKMQGLASILVVCNSHQLAQINSSFTAKELSHYRHVVVHDSAINEIPWSINVIEGSQRFYVSNLNHKIAAILSGIGIGYLPKYMADPYIKANQLAQVITTENTPPQDLYIAWKLTNKGKGLRKLTHILNTQQT
jgi:DNA-binding transcriptional LysR family regulator